MDCLLERGKALNIASVHEVDDVIHLSTLGSAQRLFETAAPMLERLGDSQRGFIDAW